MVDIAEEMSSPISACRGTTRHVAVKNDYTTTNLHIPIVALAEYVCIQHFDDL